ncbi:MAG: COX15/CtaA family protein [Anaerolineae bacterium]|nr:COX15/CtaA family protein [Anaerolineae bacterium]MDW8098943.1 COX15/CtaA family protein [Anaerolineae bacterium]
MNISTADRTSHLSVHRLMPSLILSTWISAILLITVGGIVRVTGYGLGCPDWPLCYGQVIPPALIGAWVEFTHRVLGAATGLQIVLIGVLSRLYYRNQPWMQRAALGTLGLLIVQTGLGGVHVLLEIPPITGWIHTGLAMLIVGLIAVQVAGTLPSLRSLGAAIEPFRNGRFRAWLSGMVGATYVLLLTGSYVTRSGASLACPAFPWCGSDTPAIRHLIEIQMLHRYAAFSVAFLTLVTVIWLLTRQKSPGLTWIAYGMGFLLLVQFGLGIANVLLRLPMWSRVLHLTVATLFWANVVILWTICWIRKQEQI